MYKIYTKLEGKEGRDWGDGEKKSNEVFGEKQREGKERTALRGRWVGWLLFLLLLLFFLREKGRRGRLRGGGLDGCWLNANYPRQCHVIQSTLSNKHCAAHFIYNFATIR